MSLLLAGNIDDDSSMGTLVADPFRTHLLAVLRLYNSLSHERPIRFQFGSIVSAVYADHTLLPLGKYITMFRYLGYPASRGKVRAHLALPTLTTQIRVSIHITSPNPYVKPDFDNRFMNNKADFCPDSDPLELEEDARGGEADRCLPWRAHLAPPALPPGLPRRGQEDIDIQTAKGILPNRFPVGIHMGTWHQPGDAYDASKVHQDIKYTEEDDKAVDE
ncbi:hypothetical protein FB451DRAFT_1442466 [Mycena latifolia]|nr:hypothetical protein FB451DRAFT_1442466 [Mycena latifolia]